MTTSFGPTILEKFIVYTDEMPEPQLSGAARVPGDRVVLCAERLRRRTRRGQAFLVGGFSALGIPSLASAGVPTGAVGDGTPTATLR